MSWISKLFSTVDSAANSINPMEQPMKWLTDNTIGKVPLIGKPAAQLYDFSNSHPAESGLVMLGAAGGASALGGAAADAGDVGVAADGTAMGSAAGTLGAADSSAASASLGLTAGDVGAGSLPADISVGTTGAGGATATANPTTGSTSGGTNWQQMLNQASKATSSTGGGMSAAGNNAQNSSPDYFNSLFTFGPGSVSSTPAAPTVNYPAMLLNGLGQP